MRRRPRSEPIALGRILPRVFEDLGLGASARVVQIADRWQEAVGAEIAGHSRPLMLRGEVLEVEVPSSVWAQQLQLRLPEMLRGLERVWGEEAPSQLRLRLEPRAAGRVG